MKSKSENTATLIIRRCYHLCLVTLLLGTAIASSLADDSVPPTTELPEKYGRLPGYRVQLAADSSWLEARNRYFQLQPQISYQLYLEYHSPWWKLMAGDFRSREEAAPVRHQLTVSGWPDAWIVSCPVIVSGAEAATTPEPKPPVISFYTIQVAALSDTLSLSRWRADLGELIPLEGENNWQICVGRFQSRSDATAVLPAIRQQYPEAFIRKARVTP